MKIVHIDNYEVCEENGKFLAASFVDYEGISHTIELTKELEEYLKEVRKEEFREKYRTNKYIDTGINNEDDVFEIKISINTNCKSVEDIIIEKDFETRLLKEIIKLPEKQSKHLYLKIVKEYKNVEISKKFNITNSAVNQSINGGLKKIIKKFKKF